MAAIMRAAKEWFARLLGGERVKGMKERLSRLPADGAKAARERASRLMGDERVGAAKEWLAQLFEKRFQISTQLYLGIGGATALTVLASAVGWVSFGQVDEAQSRVNKGSVPALAAAFQAAQKGHALVAAAPRLAGVAEISDMAPISEEIARDRKDFEAALAVLTRDETAMEGAGMERSKRMRAWSEVLHTNIADIKRLVFNRFSIMDARNTLSLDLAWVRKALTTDLEPAIDDQLFYAMTGHRKLGGAPDPRGRHFSEEQFHIFRYLAELRADATVALQLLSTAFNTSDAALLEPLSERFEATARGINRRLAALGDAPVRKKLEPHFQWVISLGTGTDGGFEVRARELALAEAQRKLLREHSALERNILADAEELVKAAHKSAREATLAAERTSTVARRVLLALSVISFVGALLIAWLFVGRVLSHRLGNLSRRMRRMADGDLEEEVEVDGRDEISEMASALEVFRRHALEVQRLNLVEELAQELSAKNTALEDAVAGLEKAQDQIVMREKLAALGELTAGVAHEIRNPLNFIKNFAEVSEELLDELREELDKIIAAPNGKEADGNAPAGDGKKEGEKEREKEDKDAADGDAGGLVLVQEIGEDLVGNLKRIREHGERANNIVQSMLMMGRGAGERQPTNLNSLLDEHVRLAFHSARATDPDFRLSIQQDLDEEIGSYEAIPQDLGRVFLNLVSNACYATDEKRRAIESGERPLPEGETRYEPTLSVSTKNTPDGIEVRIRDNGSGMPPEVIEKIFNPFFTTKPTDKGTGLGLSLSSDIVREHGGSIRVESEPDRFTEMIIDFPR